MSSFYLKQKLLIKKLYIFNAYLFICVKMAHGCLMKCVQGNNFFSFIFSVPDKGSSGLP